MTKRESKRKKMQICNKPCGGGTSKAGCNIVGGWGSGGESRGSIIPAKPGGLAGILRWWTWACCGACGPLWWLKNGLYGENTCDSCNDGFGIATEVDNACKEIRIKQNKQL